MARLEPVSLKQLAPQVITAIDSLKSDYGEFEMHPSQWVDHARVSEVLEELTTRLDQNFPFFHPNYAGQMIKPPHPVAMAAYLSTMMVNPNNHSRDGGQATTEMEFEVIGDLAEMFGYPKSHLGHLTLSGTTANLEALWISREINPGKAIAHSQGSHYTHTRMAEVLGVPSIAIATDDLGRMSLAALETTLKAGEVGVVVVTVGTTGLGAVDPLADIIPLARKYGARVHVDTAYGGFFRLISETLLDEESARHYRAISESDSVVVDPHKHGLQPYGCGAVLFADDKISRFYKHDSPYTYYASKEIHFGEIQLECSRPGASAAALWATLKIFGLSETGLGEILAAGVRAARNWSGLLAESAILDLYQQPALDIICFLPRVSSMSKLNEITQKIFELAGQGQKTEQIHLATYLVTHAELQQRGFDLENDQPTAKILRSVLMKPEHEQNVQHLHNRIEEITQIALES